MLISRSNNIIERGAEVEKSKNRIELMYLKIPRAIFPQDLIKEREINCTLTLSAGVTLMNSYLQTFNSPRGSINAPGINSPLRMKASINRTP